MRIAPLTKLSRVIWLVCLTMPLAKPDLPGSSFYPFGLPAGGATPAGLVEQNGILYGMSYAGHGRLRHGLFARQPASALWDNPKRRRAARRNGLLGSHQTLTRFHLRGPAVLGCGTCLGLRC